MPKKSFAYRGRHRRETGFGASVKEVLPTAAAIATLIGAISLGMSGNSGSKAPQAEQGFGQRPVDAAIEAVRAANPDKLANEFTKRFDRCDISQAVGTGKRAGNDVVALEVTGSSQDQDYAHELADAVDKRGLEHAARISLANIYTNDLGRTVTSPRAAKNIRHTAGTSGTNGYKELLDIEGNPPVGTHLAVFSTEYVTGTQDQVATTYYCGDIAKVTLEDGSNKTVHVWQYAGRDETIPPVLPTTLHGQPTL